MGDHVGKGEGNDDWKGLVDMKDIEDTYNDSEDDEAYVDEHLDNEFKDNEPGILNEGHKNENELIVHLNVPEQHAHMMGDDKNVKLGKRQWRQVVYNHYMSITRQYLCYNIKYFYIHIKS